MSSTAGVHVIVVKYARAIKVTSVGIDNTLGDQGCIVEACDAFTFGVVVGVVVVLILSVGSAAGRGCGGRASGCICVAIGG